MNNINNKVYIGKTERSIEERFTEHCNDAYRRKNEQRPLYSAMRKYGVEHFSIELLEVTNEPEARESFWINEKNSYYNGYNATLGGDGKKRIDDSLVIELYSQLKVQKEVADKLNINPDTVHDILTNNNIEIIKPKQEGKMVYVYDSTGYVGNFETLGEASRWLIDIGATKMTDIHKIRANISRAIDQKQRQTAFGFKWYSSKI